MPKQYYEEQLDAVWFELQKLPAYFTKQDLDTVVEARASVLEVRSLLPLVTEAPLQFLSSDCCVLSTVLRARLSDSSLLPADSQWHAVRACHGQV